MDPKKAVGQNKNVHGLMWALSITTAALTAITITTRAETVVFKSTDPEGNISYGDELSIDAIEFEVLKFDTAEKSNVDAHTASKARIENMVATTKRLQEDRAAREQARQAARQTAVTTPPYIVQEQNPGHTHYHKREPRYWRYAPLRGPFRPDRYHYRPDHGLDLNLGYRSSRFRGSLSLGNRTPGVFYKRRNPGHGRFYDGDFRHNKDYRGYHRYDEGRRRPPLREVRKPRAPSPTSIRELRR